MIVILMVGARTPSNDMSGQAPELTADCADCQGAIVSALAANIMNIGQLSGTR